MLKAIQKFASAKKKDRDRAFISGVSSRVPIYANVRGYKEGKKVDRPILGLIFGAPVAEGARSVKTGKSTLGSTTAGSALAGGALGSAIGALEYGIAGGKRKALRGALEHGVIGTAAGALGGAASYGIGRLAGPGEKSRK